MAMVQDRNKTNQTNWFSELIRDTRSELRKVVWPSREDTIRLTGLVVAVSVAVGTLLFVSDQLFITLYTLLLNTILPTT